MNDNERSKITSKKSDKPLIAVTGASGLVGSYLIKYLAQKGYPLIAILRSAGKPEHLFNFIGANDQGKIAVAIADVRDSQSLQAAFRGVKVVVHAAGTVNPYGARSEIFATNFAGTRNALNAAQEQKVEQFIFISSLSVITGKGDQYEVTEEAELRTCGEAYADSKAASEKLVMQKAGWGTMRVAALRPGFIYGPYEKAWMPRLINSIKEGKAALIDGGTKETNVVFVENLCRAIEGAILNPAAFGQVYNITDGEKVTKKHLLDAIADGLSLPRVNKKIPGFVAYAFCETISSVAPYLSKDQQQKLARYSRAAFRLVGLNQGFRIAKAEKELNYTDRVPFSQGMAETLAHFRSPNQPGRADSKSLIASKG